MRAWLYHRSAAAVLASFTALPLAAVLVITLFPQKVLARDPIDPYIENVRLREGATAVLLSASLKAAISDEVREAIRGGVPIDFRFRIKLTKRRTLLGEKVLRSKELIHGLQYNPAKKQFHFTGSGYGDDREVTTREEEEALGLMTGVVDLPIYPLKKLEEGGHYRVRVMATLKSAELPSVLGYIFFFTTIFNSETKWKEVDFTY